MPILRLSLPIVAGLAASTMIGVVDTIMIAPLGTVPLAAASLTTAVIIIFYSALYGFLSATGVEAAHRHGAGDEDGVARALRAGLSARAWCGRRGRGGDGGRLLPASVHRPAARGAGDPRALLVRDVRAPDPRRVPHGDRAGAERHRPAVDGGGLRLRGRDPERAVQLRAHLGRGRLGRASASLARVSRASSPSSAALALALAWLARSGLLVRRARAPGLTRRLARDGLPLGSATRGRRGIRGRGHDAGPVRCRGAGREPDRAGGGERALHAAAWHVGGHRDPVGQAIGGGRAGAAAARSRRRRWGSCPAGWCW